MNTGKCVLTDRDILIAMKLYYDGSGGGVDRAGDEWITLGGVAATDTAWADFDSKWHRMLGERYPKAPYVHMIEILDHEPPFDRPNGWNLQKKRELVSHAIVALSQMDKNEFRWFRCSLNATAVKRLYLDKHIVPANPHQQVALIMLYMMVKPYVDNVRHSDREKIFVFYDRGEKFYGPVKKEWLEKRTKPGLPRDPRNAWDFLENIEEADQAFTPPLQVSDMVASSHTRTLGVPEEREFSDLKELLTKFVPSTTLDVTEDILRQHSDAIKSGVPWMPPTAV